MIISSHKNAQYCEWDQGSATCGITERKLLFILEVDFEGCSMPYFFVVLEYGPVR
jgi:hypothetical protein